MNIRAEESKRLKTSGLEDIHVKLLLPGQYYSKVEFCVLVK